MLFRWVVSGIFFYLRSSVRIKCQVRSRIELGWNMESPQLTLIYLLSFLRLTESVGMKRKNCTESNELYEFTLSLPKVIKLKFHLQPRQKYYITQYKELSCSQLSHMRDDCIYQLSLPHLSIYFSLKWLRDSHGFSARGSRAWRLLKVVTAFELCIE